MEGSVKDGLNGSGIKHDARSLVDLAKKAWNSRLSDPALLDLVSYVGVNEFTPEMVDLLMEKGYHPFEVKSRVYTDARTRAFARTEHKRDDGTIDFLVENSNNILGLELNDNGVLPLYYINYLNIDRCELTEYLEYAGRLLEGDKRSSKRMAARYSPVFAICAVAMGFAHYDHPDLAAVAGAAGLAYMVGGFAWNAWKHQVALSRFNMTSGSNGMDIGIPALIYALDGRLPPQDFARRDY